MGHQWSHVVRLLVAALALVAWVAWAVCCTQLARAVVQQVRRGEVGTPAGAVLTDRVAARIAGRGPLPGGVRGATHLDSGAGASGPPRTVTVGRDAPAASPTLRVGTLRRHRGLRRRVPAAMSYARGTRFGPSPRRSWGTATIGRPSPP